MSGRSYNDAPRSNSENRGGNIEYYTPRGVIPYDVVDEQVRAAPQSTGGSRFYPAMYRDSEKLYAPFELPRGANSLVEVPVGTRFAMDKAAAKEKQVSLPVHPKDRGRVVKKPLNDPGVFRGIAGYDKDAEQRLDTIGLNYHPVGNVEGFNRAPLEPLSREGRQYTRRYADDIAHPTRVSTWPPRDEDGEDLASYEERYQRRMRRSEVRKARETRQK